MWFGMVTLFPAMFKAMESGITGRAIKNKLIELHYWNPRDFTHDKHRSVDDYPYGGGPGMVMMAEPLLSAISAAKEAALTSPTVIYLSPQGKKFDQALAPSLIQKKSIIFVSGRYEGIDERIIASCIDEEWSIGDYVLSGGELAAMVMIDALTRLLPGALGDANSAAEDSLTTGLLKYPQYTRPESLEDMQVPSILLSGHHQSIETWRLKQSLGKTWQIRPDLLIKKRLTEQEEKLLNEYIEEFSRNTR